MQLKYFASAVDAMEVARAQETARKHGAPTPLLTYAEREHLIDFSGKLSRLDPKAADLFTQHLSCMGDCLRDCQKERDERYGLAVLALAAVIGFICGAIAL